MNTSKSKKKLFLNGLKSGSNVGIFYEYFTLEISFELKCSYKATIISIHYFFIIMNIILSILEMEYNKNIIKIE